MLRALRALLLLSLLAGCVPARFVRFEAREIRAVNVVRVTHDAIDLVLTAQVENPNPLAARIHALRYRIFVGDRLLGRGQRTGSFDVAAHGRVVLDLPVRVAFAELPADLPTLLAGPRVAYRAEVAVDATSRLGDHHFELDRRGLVRIADSMRLTVSGDFAARVVTPRGVRMLAPTREGLPLIARVSVRNLFPFPLEIRRVEYRVFLDGALIGQGSYDQPLALGPRSSTEVDMGLTVPLTAMGAVARAVSRGGAGARVTGKAIIRPIAGIAEVPFDVRPDPGMVRSW